ncbi:hypothetical protein GCM10027258_75050 [Amycolatopsis stemonae]
MAAEGAGPGWSIVRSVAHAHGGEVVAVLVTLPACGLTGNAVGQVGKDLPLNARESGCRPILPRPRLVDRLPAHPRGAFLPTNIGYYGAFRPPERANRPSRLDFINGLVQ